MLQESTRRHRLQVAASVSAWLRRLKGEQTWDQMAERLGWTKAHLTKYVYEHTVPDLASVRRICVVFGADANDALGLTGQEASQRAA